MTTRKTTATTTAKAEAGSPKPEARSPKPEAIFSGSNDKRCMSGGQKLWSI
jgi:hypothetical protein